MSAIRRVHQSVAYSNRKKTHSHGMGEVLTFGGFVFSCMALLMFPTFLVSSFFFGENLSRVEPTAMPKPAKASHNLAEPLASLGKMEKTPSFRAKVTTTHNTRPTTEGRFEFIAPDRFHGFFDTIEMLVMGQSNYIRNNSKWVPVGVQMNICFINPTLLKTGYQLAANQQYSGEENLDGRSTSVFQYKLPCSETNYSIRLWIGNTPDALPRKLEGTADNGTKTTVIYYDYNATIVLTPPFP